MSEDALHSNPVRALRADYQNQRDRFSRAFEILESAIRDHAFPCAAIAVTHQDKIVALNGFGHFTYDASVPTPTGDTLFDLASVSKPVATTTMAMMLYERGLADLERPVCDIVPEFTSADSRRNLVTIRMLLAHSSGLPAYEKLFERARTPADLWRAAVSTPLATDPGKRSEYSDIGFIILGVALERLAGELIDQFCQREIFGPLAMGHTCFNPPVRARVLIPPTADATSQGHFIQGEVNDQNARALGGVAGHAGLFASAGDLAIFANCMLEGGKPLVRGETLSIFTRRESHPRSSRSLGWDTPSWPSQSGKYLSPGSFGHLGYTGTSLWIDPQRQLSITLLTNRTWPSSDNEAIKQVRPQFHDAIIEGLDL